MARRISFLSVRARRAGQAVRAVRRDLGSPMRKMPRRRTPPPPFMARPAFLPLTDGQAAKALLSGTLSAAGQTIDLPQGTHPWERSLPSEAFAASLHGFDWLRELAASKDPAAGALARQLTDDWGAVYSDWNIFAYRPDILARRCFAMLACWGALLDGDRDTAPIIAAKRRGLLARQIARLKKDYMAVPEGQDRLLASASLALAGAMLPDSALLDKNLDRLDDALERQVHGDGGHISRRPAAAAHILQALLTVEEALKISGIAGSKQTRRAIDRIAPALSFFNPGDGSLANFNGSGEIPAGALKALLKKTGVRPGKTFSYMPHTGYQRLERGRTIIIADAGDSPPVGFDTRAHLAPLAFELSARGKRMVVNCGYNDSQPAGWRSAVRETAAHSTLVIDDCSAGEIVFGRGAKKAFGTAISKNAGPVTSARLEEGEDVWLDAAHEGYRAATGLDHRRRIFMTGDGNDVRGEDCLYVPIGETPQFKQSRFAFQIRFHLHPDVRATLSRDMRSALLILPGKDGWRFRTDGLKLSLEPSVYLGRGRAPERCEQLVISGEALSDNNGEDKSNRVRWSFKRVSGEAGS